MINLIRLVLIKSRLNITVRVSSSWTEYTALPICLSGGTTLVSSLRALLVQEEFYSIKQCTGLSVFLGFFLITGIKQSGNTKRNQTIS